MEYNNESCKGNRLCQINRIRNNNSIIDGNFVHISPSHFNDFFTKNKMFNNINSYIEIKDPLIVRSPDERRDNNYGEFIDPLFREYFNMEDNNIDNSLNVTIYKKNNVLFFVVIFIILFILYLFK